MGSGASAEAATKRNLKYNFLKIKFY